MEIEGLAHKQTEMLARYQSIYFDYDIESIPSNSLLSFGFPWKILSP